MAREKKARSAIKDVIARENTVNLHKRNFKIGNKHRTPKAPSIPKPHVCQICGRRFTRNHNLKQHTKLHSGVKPFECEICGKRFTRNSDLRRHKTKKFPCGSKSKNRTIKRRRIVQKMKDSTVEETEMRTLLSSMRIEKDEEVSTIMDSPGDPCVTLPKPGVRGKKTFTNYRAADDSERTSISIEETEMRTPPLSMRIEELKDEEVSTIMDSPGDTCVTSAQKLAYWKDVLSSASSDLSSSESSSDEESDESSDDEFLLQNRNLMRPVDSYNLLFSFFDDSIKDHLENVPSYLFDENTVL